MTEETEIDIETSSEKRGYVKNAIGSVQRKLKLRLYSENQKDNISLDGPQVGSSNSTNLGSLENKKISSILHDQEIMPNMEVPATGYQNNEASPSGVTSSTIPGDELYTLTSLSSNMFSEPPLPQSNMVSIVVGAFVAVAGFLFGYDTGLVNSISDMPYVDMHFPKNHISFSTLERAILVSFLALGTFFGALSAPSIADKYGRKLPIVVSSLFIFSIGNTLQVSAASLALLTVGRVVSGYSIGIMSAVVPLYQAETVNRHLRGSIISLYQWAITWGLLVSSAVAQGTKNRMDSSSYRIPIGLQYVWSTVLGIGVLFLPESPRYYVLKDELRKAAESLSFLRGVPVHDSGLLEELVEIKATYDYEASIESSSLIDCFKTTEKRPKQTLRMFTGIAIQAFQQFSGINFIFYYGVNFFNSTGVHDSYIISLITYAVNVVFNVPGLFFVEYFGRRRILLCGGIIMTISNFMIAILGSALNDVIADKVMIAFICVFIASFSASWGGVVWVISAELYPLGIRAKCAAICAATNWLINFLCSFITPYIVNVKYYTSSIGSNIFFIWGSLNAASVVLVYFMVYETKGLVLEDIDELYKRASSGISSVKWNKKIREAENEVMLNPDHTIDDFIENGVRNNDDTIVDVVPEVTSTDKVKFKVNNASLTEGYEENYELENASTFNTSRFNDTTPGNSSLGNNDRNTSNTFMSHDTRSKDRYSHNEILPNINQIPISAEPKLSTDNRNYLDLGNGLGLNTYKRGPPSISPEPSIDLEHSGDRVSESLHYSEDRQQMDKINDYVAQIMYSDTHSGSFRSDFDSINKIDTDVLNLSDGSNFNVMNRGPPATLLDYSDEEFSNDTEENDDLHEHNINSDNLIFLHDENHD